MLGRVQECERLLNKLNEFIVALDAATVRQTQLKTLQPNVAPPNTLRPSTLAEYIGQADVVAGLKLAVAGAKQRGEPLEHMLLCGPPGLGKTTLAQIAASAMGARCVITSGPAIERAADLVGVLSSLQDGDFLFIDEIHRLPKVVEEFLYSAMEDFRADYIEGAGAKSRTVSIRLKKFTLVGATTRAGSLAGPFRHRFGLVYHFEYCSVDELSRGLERAAAILGIKAITVAARADIAFNARGTPRIAIRLLRRVRDYASSVGHDEIKQADVAAAMKQEGIGRYGLDQLDRKYLSTIATVYNGGPVGAAALASTLSEETQTLIDVVEPYLLIKGFIARTPRGRMLTGKGYMAVNMQPKGA